MYRFANAQNTVIIAPDGSSIPAVPGNRHYDEIIAAGTSVEPFEPPPPTEAEYAGAIQVHIDNTARTRGYADGVACASYITSTMPSWQAEAAAFVPWRDSVWLSAYTIMGQVQAGQRSSPTIQDLIAELPVITWPGV